MKKLSIVLAMMLLATTATACGMNKKETASPTPFVTDSPAPDLPQSIEDAGKDMKDKTEEMGKDIKDAGENIKDDITGENK